MFSLQLAQHAKGVKMALNEKFILKSQVNSRLEAEGSCQKELREENNKDSFHDLRLSSILS